MVFSSPLFGEVFHVKISCPLWFDRSALRRFFAIRFTTSGIRALFQICFQIRVLDGIDEVRSTGAGLQDEIFAVAGQDACDPRTVQ